MKKFFIGSIIVIASLFVKLSAGDFKVTTMYESGITKAQMILSFDKNYIYILNADGNFAKIDINSNSLIDTLLLPSIMIKYNEADQNKFFAVSPDNNFLYVLSKKLKIWNLETHEKTKTIHLTYSNYISECIPFLYYANIIYLPKNNSIYISTNCDCNKGYSTESIGNYYQYDISKDSLIRINYDREISAIERTEFNNDYTKRASSYISSYVYYSRSSPYSYYNTYLDSYSFTDSIGIGLPKQTDEQRYTGKFSFDNKDNLYYVLNDNTFNVFSFNDKSIIFKSKRNINPFNYYFFKNKTYYAGLNLFTPYVYIYDQELHQIADIIKLEDNISDFIVNADSSSAVVLLTNGNIVRLDHKCFANQDFINFVASDSIYYQGSTVNISDCSIGDFDSRKWKINGNVISETTKTLNFQFYKTGYYDVELIKIRNGAEFSFKKDSAFKIIKRTKANLTIYQNPATEAITIKFDNDENQTSTVTIYNSLGFVEAKFASNENIIKVPTAVFAVGTYYVVVSIGNRTVSGKFAVVR